MVCARDREADVGPGDERDVGQVRAAGVWVIEHPDVVVGRPPLPHRGDGVGHRTEVDRDVLGLRDHPTAVVEEGGGTVAPFLDVRRERRADERRAHLLGHRSQERADDLQLDVDHGSQSVRVAAVAYDHAEMTRGRTR